MALMSDDVFKEKHPVKLIMNALLNLKAKEPYSFLTAN